MDCKLEKGIFLPFGNYPAIASQRLELPLSHLEEGYVSFCAFSLYGQFACQFRSEQCMCVFQNTLSHFVIHFMIQKTHCLLHQAQLAGVGLQGSLCRRKEVWVCVELILASSATGRLSQHHNTKLPTRVHDAFVKHA